MYLTLPKEIEFSVSMLVPSFNRFYDSVIPRLRYAPFSLFFPHLPLLFPLRGLFLAVTESRNTRWQSV